MRSTSIMRATVGAAVMAALLGLGAARAQTLIEAGRLTADVDILALKAFSSIGTAEEGVFNFEGSERIALTYLGDSNVGVRTTYFSWDHEGVDTFGSGRILFDTYNLDVEVVKRMEISDRTVLEMSGGVRYNDTEHLLGDEKFSDFHGVGGLLGIRGGLRVLDNGMVFARGKFAVLAGDGAHNGNNPHLNPAFDMIRSQTELGLGYEHRLKFGAVTVVPRAGIEWQIWNGYSVDPVDQHPDTDLGLFGFSGGVGFVY